LPETLPRLVSIQVGMPRWHEPDGSGEAWDRRWRTAFVKQPVTGPVMLHQTNLAGDMQADTQDHGGPERAVLAYSADHYDRWREEFDWPDLAFGGFGENFTISGQDEWSVCIGDIYDIGDARVQVSRPRGPCYKIEYRWRRRGLLRRVEETGRHGWYMRVLREGLVSARDEVRLVDRPEPGRTVRFVADAKR
jgi:MOSC domain-containing protein YiiM